VDSLASGTRSRCNVLREVGESEEGVQIPLLRGSVNFLDDSLSMSWNGDRKDGLRWIRELDEMSVWKSGGLGIGFAWMDGMQSGRKGNR
jgi:hypothetical protein